MRLVLVFAVASNAGQGRLVELTTLMQCNNQTPANSLDHQDQDYQNSQIRVTPN